MKAHTAILMWKSINFPPDARQTHLTLITINLFSCFMFAFVFLLTLKFNLSIGRVVAGRSSRSFRERGTMGADLWTLIELYESSTKASYFCSQLLTKAYTCWWKNLPRTDSVFNGPLQEQVQLQEEICRPAHYSWRPPSARQIPQLIDHRLLTVRHTVRFDSWTRCLRSFSLYSHWSISSHPATAAIRIQLTVQVSLRHRTRPLSSVLASKRCSERITRRAQLGEHN